MMEMFAHNYFKFPVFLTVLLLLTGCGVMDGIMPSGGTYKVNARVNDLPIDEFSIFNSSAKIQPYFDNAVSNDPDVTALMVFLRNSRGDVTGWKVVYTVDDEADQELPPESGFDQSNYREDQDIQETEQDSNENANASDYIDLNEDDNNSNGNEDENEEDGENTITEENTSKDLETVIVETQQNEIPYKNGDQLIIKVKNLDDDLPYFPIPSDLPMGRYILVSQVMRGDQILHKNEKPFYFLANANFSFDGIEVHRSGIAENRQLISKGTVLMLEAKLDFDSRLDPYIVWYNGRKIISEGNFSQGTGNLLWKTPEQTGFSSIRAEIFPVANRQGLAGFVKDISILVSSRTQDMHYIREDSPNLLHWYLLEGDLNDVKMNASADNAIKKAYINPLMENIPPRWMPSNGIFGLAAGFNNAYSLPGVSFQNNADNVNSSESWQILSRFKPLNNGVILSVQFGSSSDAVMNLSLEENNLILSLSSPSESVSKIYNLSKPASSDPEADSFLTAEINFSVLADSLTAKLNVIREHNFESDEKEEAKPISLEAELIDKYRIILGSQSANNTAMNGYANSIARNSTFTALWDELALYYIPYAEKEISDTEDEEPDELIKEEPAVAEKIIEEKPAIIHIPAENEQTEPHPEAEEQLGEDNPLIAEDQPVYDDDHYSIN